MREHTDMVIPVTIKDTPASIRMMYLPKSFSPECSNR